MASGTDIPNDSSDRLARLVAGDNIGALLLRNTHHYWFQAGEAHAERQMLGHGVLSQFVGSFERCSY